MAPEPLRTSAGAAGAAVVWRLDVHSADEPCIAEELLDRLMPAMLRSGALAPETVLELADQLDREAQIASIAQEHALGRMATALRAWVIGAEGPERPEWEAERRRKRLRIVPASGPAPETP